MRINIGYNNTMTKLVTDKLTLSINEEQLSTLHVVVEQAARRELARLWHTDSGDLSHYLALFSDKKIKQLNDDSSFITLSFSAHGYVIETGSSIDIGEAKKQIEIDLEIINRESQWSAKESIYFDDWWPKPYFDVKTHTLEFGVALKDFHQRVINRTLNRLILTRYGHIAINYSLSEQEINSGRPISDYQKCFDEIVSVLTIAPDDRYEAINEDSDRPSKSGLVNLILSAEIF